MTKKYNKNIIKRYNENKSLRVCNFLKILLSIDTREMKNRQRYLINLLQLHPRLTSCGRI